MWTFDYCFDASFITNEKSDLQYESLYLNSTNSTQPSIHMKNF